MSAWKKQAVPLVFLEIGMGAVTSANPSSEAINRVAKRVDTWIDAAWQPIREKGRIDDFQAQRVTVRAAANIKKYLEKAWQDGGIKSPSELPAAMLAIAEDVRQQLPRNDKRRIRAWGYLVVALFDLFKIADPDLSDRAGEDRGLEIAKIVMREAV